MSSPAGVQPSEIGFLARWMPSRHRAGVILNASLDAAGSSKESWVAREPDDSFASQFMPLPVSGSGNSSCISLDSLVPADHPVEMKLLDRCASTGRKTGDCAMAQKLEELKELQRSMEEQLKAHQAMQLYQQSRLGAVSQRSSSAFAGSSLLTGKGTVSESSQGPVMVSPIGLSDPSQTPTNLLPVRPELSRLPAQPLEQDQASVDVVGERDVPPASGAILGADGWEQNHSYNQHSVDQTYNDAKIDNDEREESTASMNNSQFQNTDSEEQSLQPSDDRPIKPGIGRRKQTFEELLEEQLKLEEQRMKAVQLEPTAVKVNPPQKRTFLRRGEGLSRFTKGKTVPQRRVNKDDYISVPPKPSPRSAVVSGGSIQKNSLPQRSTIQRKTTVLNKESRAEHQPIGWEPKRSTPKGSASLQARVLGRSQRQNIMAPALRRTKSTEMQQQDEKESGLQCGRLEHLSRPPPSKAMVVTKCMGGEAISGVQRQMQMRPVPVAAQPPAEYSFELSFQEKLERWDCEKLQENAELGEFELLEQAAEELSFSSNSSFVMKVLQLDRQSSKGPNHHRRLSSTPIKSPKRTQATEMGGCPPICPSAVRLENGAPQPEMAQDVKESNDPHVKEAQIMPDTDATGMPCHSSLEFEDQNDTVRELEVHPAEPALPGPLCLPVVSGAQYDRTSYQDRGVCFDQAEGEESWENTGVQLEQHEDTPLTESGQPRCADQLVFDDDDTWNEVEEEAETARSEDDEGRTGISGHTHVSTEAICCPAPPDGALERKMEERGLCREEGHQVSSPPPTSQLVVKMFPSLKPKVNPAPPTTVEPPKTVAEQVTGPNPSSRQLTERLVMLEFEIERFKEENAKLALLKQEREASLETLRKEMVAFERKKAKELAELEEKKKEEMRKLQKERRVFERHASAARAMPDKKEREEIQALKQRLSYLQDELRRREARWSSTHSRLRQQLDSLGAENAALRDEIRVLEKLRVTSWKKAEAEKERSSKQTHNTSQAGTRRCKSASPPGAPFASTSLSLSTRGSTQCHSSPDAGKPISHQSEGRRASGPRRWRPELPDHRPHKARELAVESSEEEEDQSLETREIQEVVTHPDGKIEQVLHNGGRIIVFPNGTRKEVSADGRTMKITFFNGDVKQVTDDQQVIYYYADSQTTHTTYPDGMEVLRFPNNQIEKHFPDGRKEITFPDQTVKNLFPDGKEESIFPDGTVIEAEPDGSKVIRFNNGQREVHRAEFKRREYPDGTAKTIYADGRQETRYPTGRLRVKDKDGCVIIDTMT